MRIQMVVFSEPKSGYEAAEWQDGACGGVIGDPDGPADLARFIVADGATVSYDSARWVDQLVTSFIPPPGAPAGPALDRGPMRAWFERMQDDWAANAPRFVDDIDKSNFEQVGSRATLLGFEISGLDGPEPSWRAVALGDTVLFHVRADRAIATFPPLGPDDFGTNPDSVSTLESGLDQMAGRLLVSGGVLDAGDLIFAATDAMAHWIIRAIRREQTKVWRTLAGLAHPDVFTALVADQRREADAAKRLKDDDVTLMRLRILADQPSLLLACLLWPRSPPPVTTTGRCRRPARCSPWRNCGEPSSPGT